jgi:hypothetical protein
MYTQNKIIENSYLKYFLKDQKLFASSVIAITLCYILRNSITLYHSIANLSFLNVIALGT